MRRRLPEVAACLYALLLILVLLVVLPAVGVIPDPLAVGILTVLGWVSLVAVVTMIAATIVAALDCAWTLLLRHRDRKRDWTLARTIARQEARARRDLYSTQHRQVSGACSCTEWPLLADEDEPEVRA